MIAEVYGLAYEVADTVFSVQWDTGNPLGGAGYDFVYHLDGKYFIASEDEGCHGPFDTLDKARGTISVNGIVQSIRCWEWSEEEILDRMVLDGDVRGVEINGTWWPFERLEHEVARRRGTNGRR